MNLFDDLAISRMLAPRVTVVIVAGAWIVFPAATSALFMRGVSDLATARTAMLERALQPALKGALAAPALRQGGH
jgi:hypothetical protein